MGATGLALVLFTIVHLLGNLTLYSQNGDLTNAYSARLHGLGMLLVIAEWGLWITIVVHIVTAIQVTLRNKTARPVHYDEVKSKHGPTKNTISSRNMFITGAVLLVFLVIHMKQFRFGPNIEQGYTATVNGVMVHDIYRVVGETFADLRWVIFYVASMLFLGFHFRHGFWSMFQSLGAMNPRWSKPIYLLGFLLALILALGFLGIPIYMYSNSGGNA